jgi:hypothetical protein
MLMLREENLTPDTLVSAVCTEQVDVGITGINSRFHLYIPTPKGKEDRTFCGILADYMIDQGVQGKLKDADVSCRRCFLKLHRIKKFLSIPTDESKCDAP